MEITKKERPHINLPNARKFLFLIFLELLTAKNQSL